MSKHIVLYNPLSNLKRGLEEAKRIENQYPGDEFEYVDMTTAGDLYAFINGQDPEAKVVFTGGDGTVNHVVNVINGRPLIRELFYFPAGTGNDFTNDIGKGRDGRPFAINEYLKGLPKVRFNGRELLFVNGVGVGLDGYTCQEYDRLKALGRRQSYTFIAFKGLVSRFTPVNAKVTVDGETRKYAHCWMVPTMWGAYYGAGVKIAPTQVRGNAEGLVTSTVVHCPGRIRTMTIFPRVVSGKGLEIPQYIDYRQGHEVTVEFDRPVPMQIDGETFLGVTSYTVTAGAGHTENDK